MGWMAKSQSPDGVKNFPFSMWSRLTLGLTKVPVQWVLLALSLGVKLLGCEADRSPPSGDKIKKTWTYISIPSFAFMA
jgi:hypothetical protein